MSKAEIWIPHSEYRTLVRQVTKSLKHDSIDNLCLCLKKEQTGGFITLEHVSNLGYKALTPKLKLNTHVHIT